MRTKPLPTLVTSVLVLLAILCFTAYGQEPSAEPATGDATAAETAESQEASDEEAAHDALRELRALYERAINERDLSLLFPHLHDEVSGVMVTADVVSGRAGIEAYWQEIQDLIGEGGTYSTELEPELSWIHGDVAVAKGATRDLVTLPNGREFRFSTYFTAVLTEGENGWQIRRMQGTMDPVENPFIAAAVRTATIGAAVVAGALALVIGLAAGIWWGRRR